MNRKPSKNNKKQGGKRRKLHTQTEVEQSGYIFKLPVEIIEYIFDYLLLKDLVAMSQTCKFMQRVAVQCYQQTFFGHTPRYFKRGEIFMGYKMGTVTMDQPFVEIFDKVIIHGHDQFKYFLSERCEFLQLRKLAIFELKLNESFKVKLKRTQRVLNRLDVLRLNICEFDKSSLEYLLSLAPNIKRLSLIQCSFDKIGLKCFRSKYPMLTHCEFILNDVVPIKTFLEMNPNIKSFGINVNNLYENRESIINAKINLDSLTISMQFSYDSFNREIIERLVTICPLLNEMHRIGLYNRLKVISNITFYPFDNEMVKILATLNALESFSIGPETPYLGYIFMSPLKHLKEINVSDSMLILDLETLATTFNLKTIHFGRTNINHLMWFISRNARLNKIKVNFFLEQDGNFDIHKAIDLSAMNRERSKLPGANKIIMYVKENVYLATKRAQRDTNLEFIQLKRYETAHEWDCDFNFFSDYNKETFRGIHTEWQLTGQKIVK